MKITINQTAAALDPHSTTTDPDQSLVNYILELTAAIRQKYPDAVIEHHDIDDTYAIRVTDDPAGDIAAELQGLSEQVYATGNFWV
jgi:type IV secretory pathway TrbF-like protein